MMKRLFCLLLSLLLAGGLVGCASSAPKRSQTYMDVFDTVTEITAYGMSAKEFKTEVAKLHDELMSYHRLYDIYNTYPDMNNLKTVNDAAGAAVKVDARVLDLLEYGLEAYAQTEGRVNIMLGSVLSLWHDARAQGLANPADAALPDAAKLDAASAYVSPASLVIDRAAGTVRLTTSAARIDVGAIAKGYVVERIARYAEQELGWSSALISVGGNIRAIGGKGGADSTTPFAVGIQNPDTTSAKTYLTTVNIRNMAVVTSGDYQRYYTVNGKNYAHIIDPDTLYPAEHVRSVTVVCADSALADVLSTALFCLPLEQGKALLADFPRAQAVWALTDGSLQYSAGFAAYMGESV
jgi:thiamine biosynthesis lipoprotein